MSPYEIDILLWYHARCEDHPDIRRDPPIWQPTMRMFVEEGLLRCPSDPNGIRKDMCYEPTARLHFYVDAICSIPLPRCAWVVDWPRPERS